MLAPVLIANGEPIVLPYREALADNFLDAYVLGVKAEINTGWRFTNTLVDIDIASGKPANVDGVFVVHLDRVGYARE